jgi:hypothetical protein
MRVRNPAWHALPKSLPGLPLILFFTHNRASFSFSSSSTRWRTCGESNLLGSCWRAQQTQEFCRICARSVSTSERCVSAGPLVAPYVRDSRRLTPHITSRPAIKNNGGPLQWAVIEIQSRNYLPRINSITTCLLDIHDDFHSTRTKAIRWYLLLVFSIRCQISM